MLTDSESALARAVLIHGPISRSALTPRLGLSPASLTRLAKPFLDRGILIELDDVDGRIGRAARRGRSTSHPDSGRFVGVKLTGDRLYAVATDVRASVLERARNERCRRPIPRPSRTRSCETLDELGEVAAGRSRHQHRRQRPRTASWSRRPSSAGATSISGRSSRGDSALPVTLENDLVALAEAERWFGLGRGMPGFSVITIGAGVGYALVVHGEVVHSREAGLGLGGHIPLAANGPVCHAGHRGCAEAMLTSGSIAAQVSAALQRDVGYDEVLALAQAGDPAARAVMDAAADALGRFIALAANLTLQPAVVLAGRRHRALRGRRGAGARGHARGPRSPRRPDRDPRRRVGLRGMGPRRRRRRDPGCHRATRPRGIGKRNIHSA